jgi:2'-5' RNA ligase
MEAREMRLFLALWPDAQAREKLGALAHDLAVVAEGKPVPLEKVHLTLAFLGEVPQARMADVVRAAAATSGERFDLVLDRVGSFRGARVAWAGASEPPPRLVALQASLAANLRSAGFTLEERAFAPHLTLVRKVARSVPRAAIAPIASAAREFALVRSETGTGRYTTLETWPLREE